MVGHNDSRALHLEVLQSLHLKPQAEEILEGLDNSFDDSAEEKSSQQQGKEVTGSAIPSMGGRRQEELCGREPPVSFALCLSCMVPCAQRASVACEALSTPSVEILLEAWAKLTVTLRPVQLESMVHVSFKLTASDHNQAHYELFGRGESSLVLLEVPCEQRPNWKPSKVQEGETLVSTPNQGPLLLLPVLST